MTFEEHVIKSIPLNPNKLICYFQRVCPLKIIKIYINLCGDKTIDMSDFVNYDKSDYWQIKS